jgi:type IV secretion system protein VirB10
MRFSCSVISVLVVGWSVLAAQTPAPETPAAQVPAVQAPAAQVPAVQAPAAQAPAPGWRRPGEPKPGDYVIEPGTRIPLTLINSVSTRHSAEGDRVYLETAFPMLANGRVVIPPGSYVAGTITQVKRPGRVKGRGELYLRFDSITLPNGVTRDFRARIGGLDGRANEELDRGEGKIKSEGNKSGDARTVGEAAAAGASVGVIAGGAAGHYGMGAGIGAAAGAAAGIMGVLLSRGPDAILAKGSTIEMVLDRALVFQESELDFSRMMPHTSSVDSGGGPLPSQRHQQVPLPGRRWPM